MSVIHLNLSPGTKDSAWELGVADDIAWFGHCLARDVFRALLSKPTAPYSPQEFKVSGPVRSVEVTGTITF